jgi:uncharacterized protein (UPF0333 family)
MVGVEFMSLLLLIILVIIVNAFLFYLNKDAELPNRNAVKNLRKLYEKRKKERAKKHKEFANILNRKVNDNK